MNLNKMLCKLGKFDIPIIQQQPEFLVDLLDSNIILFGASMSGKTSFLKNLVNVMHKRFNTENEQIFILDFGGAMSEYRNMPLVAAYYDNSNEEYVKRIFRIMDNILKENIRILNGRNFREAGNEQPVHTTFLIDNFNAFIDEQRYCAYQDKFVRLSRDGLSKGITLVITAGDTKGLGSYSGSFRQKIAFEMPPDKYNEIFIGKTGTIGNNPGHGFANVTIKPEGITGTFKMNLPYEVQCSKPESINDGLSDYCKCLKRKFKYTEETSSFTRQVKKYLTFPKELNPEEYKKLSADKNTDDGSLSVGVGLDYINFDPVYIDFDKSHVAAIYGKKEFGKTNLLNILLEGIAKKDSKARFVFFDDGRQQLSDIYNNFKENYDSVMINQFETIELQRKDGTSVTKKLSPMQQFYIYLNRHYIELDKKSLASYFDLSDQLKKEYENVPDCESDETPLTVFVIQSKQIYLNTVECRRFISSILPQLAAVADERKYIFIFSDVQKISDGEQNAFFNNIISGAFLLDNIAEFAGERGQKTIFGNMDVKYLKEEYARCELGDGYFYDVEGDRLQKLKYIKNK